MKEEDVKTRLKEMIAEKGLYFVDPHEPSNLIGIIDGQGNPPLIVRLCVEHVEPMLCSYWKGDPVSGKTYRAGAWGSDALGDHAIYFDAGSESLTVVHFDEDNDVEVVKWIPKRS